MDTLQERLRVFIKSQHLTIKEFENRCGLSNGYVNGIQRTIGADKLEAIVRLFPNLNKDWLLSGNGEMLTSENTGGEINYAAMLKDAMAVIKQQSQQIQMLIEIVRENQLSEPQKETVARTA